jgi:hypothetical protein
MKSNTGTSSTFTERRNLLRISTEASDEVPNPEKSGSLIVQAEIRRRFVERSCFVEEVLTGKESEPVEAIAGL